MFPYPRKRTVIRTIFVYGYAGAGIARGLGYGQSTIAGIVTRGAVEMKRVALRMGGKEDTLNGLSGLQPGSLSHTLSIS